MHTITFLQLETVFKYSTVVDEKQLRKIKVKIICDTNYYIEELFE